MSKFVALTLLFFTLGCLVQAQELDTQAFDTVEEYRITHQGLERRFLLYTPPQAGQDTLLPLVFMLHGGAGSPETYMELTSFNDKAREEGFYVIYPGGTGLRSRIDNILTWNAGHCCGAALRNNHDDVGFFRDMIALVTDELAIDTNRIYVAGLSNGGMMAYRLAAELSDLFAAAAVSSGSIGGYLPRDPDTLIMPPQPENAVPILHVHGIQDDQVPFYGGEEPYHALSVQDALDFWVEANQCDPNAQTVLSDDEQILRTTYTCDATSTTVNLIALVNGGHSWGGLFGVPASQQPININDEIWSFFEQYPCQDENC